LVRRREEISKASSINDLVKNTTEFLLKFYLL